ncbi:molybdate ABC transporter substrate-binding protein [Halodesulfovibrio marinisediminis]|uniref:Molybdate transport system substrate-binding protein n=1 Tax=Halodesulfovibrio marinisediminis DSM 17456 TaxID=1121457 RepID=A0A1N6GWY0_9BACT|nr:molybdate ABC transporter substrate-binding protein [Halodesulfovibrio marinisediminis]SIO12101.1 molybdate transport system substrate-binding protein [Halodesulfovibrio marinisediminis DSM 17456]
MKRLLTFMMILCVALPAHAHAADLVIAQAANFMPAMKEIIPAFEKETGLTVQATYTSTGKLYGQIISGAPFDIFLAADTRRPEKLFAENLALEPFVYAKGQIVLWTRNKKFCEKPWKETLQSSAVTHIAIANTETAPYGTVAKTALVNEKLWKELQPKLAIGQSISQVFQYVATGAADAGFCAYSYMFTPEGKKGCFVQIPEAPKVIQKACILKNSQHKQAAQKFATFLGSPKVAAIKHKYGYE